MAKRKSSKILISTLTSISLGLALVSGALFAKGANETAASVGSYSTNASTYYSGVSTSLSGTSLALSLHNLMISTHRTYTSYADVGNYTLYTDTDPNNSSNIICLYSGASVAGAWDSGNTWNREHVWCQSLSNGLWGTTGAGSDLQHLRPTIPTVNSTRNNRLYSDLNHTGTSVTYNGSATGCYYDANDHFEPRDAVKGDIARILMYVYVHYTTDYGGSTNSYTGNLNITDVFYTATGTDAAAWTKILAWNAQDPVDSFERARNEQAAKYQGNRNPFIDNASYAGAIWAGGSQTDPTSSSSSSASSSSSNVSSSTSTSVPTSSTSSGSIAITRSSFSSVAGYGTVDSWTAGGVSGTCDLYTATSYMQVNGSSSTSLYLNSAAMPGNITAITIANATTGTAREWNAYVSASTKLTASNFSTSGTALGAKTATSNSGSVTWTVGGSYKYFYLDLTGTSAAYIATVTIAYAGTSGSSSSISSTTTSTSTSTPTSTSSSSSSSSSTLTSKTGTVYTSATAINGAIAGWTTSGTSAYSDGSIKMDSTGDYMIDSSIWNYTKVTKVVVTVAIMQNGGTTSTKNVVTVYAMNGSTAVGNVAKTGSFALSKTTYTFTITLAQLSVTGLKIAFTSKVTGNIGIYSVSATPTYLG